MAGSDRDLAALVRPRTRDEAIAIVGQGRADAAKRLRSKGWSFDGIARNLGCERHLVEMILVGM